MALAKSIYAVPTWTRLVALVTEHPALHAAITAGTPVPSVYACYRVTASLSAQLPEYGRNVAIDGSDMPAYSLLGEVRAAITTRPAMRRR